MGYTEGPYPASRWKTDSSSEHTFMYRVAPSLIRLKGRNRAGSGIYWPRRFLAVLHRSASWLIIVRVVLSTISHHIGLATVANMGAEVGATTSTFPYTPSMRNYLIATGRAAVARAADDALAKGFLSADEDAEYDEIIDIVRPCMSSSFYSIPDLSAEPVRDRAHHQRPIHT